MSVVRLLNAASFEALMLAGGIVFDAEVSRQVCDKAFSAINGIPLSWSTAMGNVAGVVARFVLIVICASVFVGFVEFILAFSCRIV